MVYTTPWYIYYLETSDKIRVVFDCSASIEGESLNTHLLQGPDLTNKLLGVLCRFRKEPIAVMCDIEQMFYQFRVTKNTAIISGSCVGIQTIAKRNLLNNLWQCTYLVLHPRKDVQILDWRELQQTIKQSSGKKWKTSYAMIFALMTAWNPSRAYQKPLTWSTYRKGRLRLCKFVSNEKEVIDFLVPDDRAKDLKDIKMVSDKLPLERALGITWWIESDSFKCKIDLKDRPLTRRGVLSSVSSLYGPLGFIAPVILAGKQILQQMCAYSNTQRKSHVTDLIVSCFHDKTLHQGC